MIFSYNWIYDSQRYCKNVSSSKYFENNQFWQWAGAHDPPSIVNSWFTINFLTCGILSSIILKCSIIINLLLAEMFSFIVTKISCPKTQQHGVLGTSWGVQMVKYVWHIASMCFRYVTCLVWVKRICSSSLGKVNSY